MKTQVFVSQNEVSEDNKIDSITILPAHITFSDVEEYSTTEMNTYAFLSRINFDASVEPIIGGALKEEAFAYFDQALYRGIEQFYFIMNETDMNHYNPIIDEYKKTHPDLQVLFHIPESSLYCHYLLAIKADEMFKAGNTPEDITTAIMDMDATSKVYLYSPEVKLEPVIEKFSYDEDILVIRGKKSYMHILNHDKTMHIHLKEKYKDIASYLEDFKKEIKNKDYQVFLLYTDKDSKYTEYLTRILTQVTEEDSLKISLIPEHAAMEYGINSVAFGYIKK